MTRNEILKLLNEFFPGGYDERMVALARVFIKAEREACAKVCEDKNTLLAWPTYAHAIRARGQA